MGTTLPICLERIVKGAYEWMLSDATVNYRETLSLTGSLYISSAFTGRPLLLRESDRVRLQRYRTVCLSLTQKMPDDRSSSDRTRIDGT